MYKKITNTSKASLFSDSWIWPTPRQIKAAFFYKRKSYIPFFLWCARTSTERSIIIWE